MIRKICLTIEHEGHRFYRLIELPGVPRADEWVRLFQPGIGETELVVKQICWDHHYGHIEALASPGSFGQFEPGIYFAAFGFSKELK